VSLAPADEARMWRVKQIPRQFSVFFAAEIDGVAQ